MKANNTTMKRTASKPTTEQQKEQIMQLFFNTKDNGSPSIAKKLNISRNKVTYVIDNYFKQKSLNIKK